MDDTEPNQPALIDSGEWFIIGVIHDPAGDLAVRGRRIEEDAGDELLEGEAAVLRQWSGM